MAGLKLSDERKEDVWFIKARGYLDANTSDDLDELIAAVLQEGCCKIAFDLSGVTFISSAGAGVLMAAFKLAQSQGGGVVFINPSDNVRGVFKTLGLHEIFAIVGSARSAAARLSE